MADRNWPYPLDTWECRIACLLWACAGAFLMFAGMRAKELRSPKPVTYTVIATALQADSKMRQCESQGWPQSDEYCGRLASAVLGFMKNPSLIAPNDPPRGNK